MNAHAVLTVAATGEVQLTRSVLDHLGVGAGDRLCLDLLPDGRAEVRAVPRGHISSFIGMLAVTDEKALTIQEMNDVIVAGWAGEH